MSGGAGEAASFTAGDLTIRQASGTRADSLSRQAQGLLAPWLADAGFVFQGVPG